MRIRVFPSRLPDCQPVAECLKNLDSASQVLLLRVAVVRVSVQLVAQDVSRAAVRRAVPVARQVWLVVDLAAEMPDSEVRHASEPEAAGYESVPEDQSRAVRRNADTPV